MKIYVTAIISILFIVGGVLLLQNNNDDNLNCKNYVYEILNRFEYENSQDFVGPLSKNTIKINNIINKNKLNEGDK